MSTKHFANCKTIEELKVRYKKLIKTHHPDNGGDMETMQDINVEYDHLFNVLKHIHNAKTENKENQNEEKPEEFRNIINSLINLEGLIIEICGSWIWLSGNTFKFKDTIKQMGFKYAPNKKMWYLGKLRGRQRKPQSMDDIRNKYGSDVYISKRVLQLEN
jgi:curved DNA-binding protein CbpA